jgi:hypothetical protein
MARRTIAILVALAAGLLPSPAFSTVVVASFTGVLTGGNDSTGYFTGTPGFDLTTVDGGLLTPYFSGTFSYDTNAIPSDGSGYYGNDGFAPNWLGFSVTIAGTTYAFGLTDGSGGNFQSISVADGPDDLSFLLSRDGVDGPEFAFFDLSGEEFLTGTDLPADFTYQSASGGFGLLNIQTGGVNLDAAFSINCASTDPSICVLPGGGDNSVPEPAAWLSLGLGFGAMGAWLRWPRRRTPGNHNKNGRLQPSSGGC